MTSATMINAADDFSRHVKAAMMFDEYLDIENEGQTEGRTKNDIEMLRELAEKLMELVQEAGGEARPRAVKVDVDIERKDIALVPVDHA
jgi:hypothetical protein